MLISYLKSALIYVSFLLLLLEGKKKKKRELFSSTSKNKIEIIPMQGSREGREWKTCASSFHALMTENFLSHFFLFATLSTWRIRPYPAGTRGFAEPAHNWDQNFKTCLSSESENINIEKSTVATCSIYVGSHFRITHPSLFREDHEQVFALLAAC